MIRRPPRSTLFPYTTLFRSIGEVPEGMGKYVSLRGSGNHLYLFPGTDPEKIVAFTEGSFGAIVAVESGDRKSTRLNSSHANISYAVFCLKKKKIVSSLIYIH